MNDSENTASQNSWGAANTVLRGKSRALKACIRQESHKATI